ncbi:dCTP deaminase domain-containing protein [Rahnella inusitata]|uniref:dUTPase-like domain-containing protein n=1 Tax=Rahnella inusitata TaxID=58169 RepID=A0ABX9P6P5_9GAMM|nr:hypothetical protein [Rahnella inusitata]RJT16057.1 hypothetical protein D5396_02785 [Rahnella inusitata]
MQLSAIEAIRLGFVRDKNGNLLDPTLYTNNSSIDLTVGEVVFKDENGEFITGTGTTIDPQQSMLIISDEIINVPSDYIAYVFLKNRLSQRGLLALNTGIIDSNYTGPISTLIINFSNVNAAIPSGRNRDEREFFRVVFHKIDSSPLALPNIERQVLYKNKKYNSYKKRVTKNLKSLPKTFLEPTVLKTQIKKEIYEKISEFSLVKVGLMIAAIGLFFTLISGVKDLWFGWKYDVEKNISEQQKYEIKINGLNADVEDLKKRIHDLERVSENRNNNG